MKMLGGAWEKWVSKDKLVKAAKRVGITDTGLNVHWMDKSKFESAAGLLHRTPILQKPIQSNSSIQSPLNVSKGTTSYYEQSMKRIQELENSIPSLDEIPDLLRISKIKP